MVSEQKDKDFKIARKLHISVVSLIPNPTAESWKEMNKNEKNKPHFVLMSKSCPLHIVNHAHFN